MIRFENVSFSYANDWGCSLRNLSLHINKGECVLLCGASGCGKTTITRLINGLIPHFFTGHFSGEIRIGGMNPVTTDIALLSDLVGTVFQNPRTQFFNTDTDSELVFGLENRSIRREEIKMRLEELTNEFHLEPLRGRNIFALSGGEKQKIAFSSVYASEPELLVLDEPSSNLDAASVKELTQLISKAKAAGKTIVIAEHRLWYLMDLADRVIFMRNGVLERDMSIKEFRNLPAEVIEAMGLRCRSLNETRLKPTSIFHSEKTLEIKDLKVSLKGQDVLKGLSFSVGGGEIIAIAGANGVGKTTLARTICGLQKELSGTISVNGKKLSRKKRKRCSYIVMQDVGHQLFTDSVLKECRLGIKKPDETRIDNALRMLELEQYRERHPLSLSGGQKQRLAVAVSLICNRDVLIFDEPTSGLDLVSMEEVGKLAQELSRQGKILLIVTHDIEFMKSICSRILVLSDGRIVADLTEKEREKAERILRG